LPRLRPAQDDAVLNRFDPDAVVALGHATVVDKPLQKRPMLIGLDIRLFIPVGVGPQYALLTARAGVVFKLVEGLSREAAHCLISLLDMNTTTLYNSLFNTRSMLPLAQRAFTIPALDGVPRLWQFYSL